MSYLTDTDAVCATLTKAAQRGYLSKPVKRWSWSDTLSQRVEFTDTEVLAVRGYQAKYATVLAAIRYRQPSFFSPGEQSWSAPLLQMLTYMLDDPTPDYVMANVQRLKDAVDERADLFKAVDFELEMRL